MGLYANRMLAEFICKVGEKLKKSGKRKEINKDRERSVKKR